VKETFYSKVESIESHWVTEFRLLLEKLERKTSQIEKSEVAIRTATMRVKQWKALVKELQNHVQLQKQDESRSSTSAMASSAPPSSTSVLPSEIKLNQKKVLALEKQLVETQEKVRKERMNAREKIQELIHAIR
jgi:hypothetical protein